jgi:hypothetical protein
MKHCQTFRRCERGYYKHSRATNEKYSSGSRVLFVCDSRHRDLV